MLRLVAHLFRALGVVLLRRLRGERVVPAWSFGYELLVTTLRIHAAFLGGCSIAELRRLTEKLQGKLAPNVDVRKSELASVPVTWFTPREAESGRALLYVHGGAHVFGSANQDRAIASQLAATCRIAVCAPDYRLAPEAPCPADIDDLAAVYAELITSHQVDIAGLSSGAAAALTTLCRLRNDGARLPARAVLLSPLVDASGTSPSWEENDGIDWGIPQALREWSQQYAADLPLSDPRVSPLHASLEGLPKLLILVGSAELLCDDAVELAERARRAGVSAQLLVEPNQVHAYMTLGLDNAATRRAFELTRQFLEKRA